MTKKLRNRVFSVGHGTLSYRGDGLRIAEKLVE